MTNETEAFGNYQSVARSTYLHQGFVRITNNGNGYVGIAGGTECNVLCNTIKLNVYLERSSGDGNFYSYKKWENVDYNEASLYYLSYLTVLPAHLLCLKQLIKRALHKRVSFSN